MNKSKIILILALIVFNIVFGTIIIALVDANINSLINKPAIEIEQNFNNGIILSVGLSTVIGIVLVLSTNE